LLGALAPPVLLAWDARVNRIQALVLGFFLVVWVSLLVILVVAPLVILLMAPEVYDQALRLLPGGRRTELAVLAAPSRLGSPTGKPSHAVGAGPDCFVVGADPGPPARPTRLVWWVASGLLRPGSASAAPDPTGRLLGRLAEAPRAPRPHPSSEMVSHEDVAIQCLDRGKLTS
jgi:hypothetical protein